MKTIFNLESFKRGKYAVSCKTRQEAKEFFKYLDGKGVVWKEGGKLLARDLHWSDYEWAMFYSCDKYGLVNQYHSHYKKYDYTIYDYRELIFDDDWHE